MIKYNNWNRGKRICFIIIQKKEKEFKKNWYSSSSVMVFVRNALRFSYLVREWRVTESPSVFFFSSLTRRWSIRGVVVDAVCSPSPLAQQSSMGGPRVLHKIRQKYPWKNKVVANKILWEQFLCIIYWWIRAWPLFRAFYSAVDLFFCYYSFTFFVVVSNVESCFRLGGFIRKKKKKSINLASFCIFPSDMSMSFLRVRLSPIVW